MDMTIPLPLAALCAALTLVIGYLLAVIISDHRSQAQLNKRHHGSNKVVWRELAKLP